MRFDVESGYALQGRQAFPVLQGAGPPMQMLDYVPQLSLAERDRRWRGLRRRMLLGGYDALLFIGNDMGWDMGMANLRYMFQFGSKLGGWVLFGLEGEPVIWHAIPHMSRPLEISLSRQQWVRDFRPFSGVQPIVDELRRRGLDKAKLGLTGYQGAGGRNSTLGYANVTALQKALPQANIDECTWMVQEMRLVKSEEEIGMLRQAGKISRKVVDTMIEFARPGVTEARLWAEMMKTQVENGAEPDNFNLLSSGPVEHPHDEVWNLLHGAAQPMVPTMRPLGQGDLIISEFHTKYGGYLCHTEFTVYLGRPAPRQLRDIWNVCVECLHISREVLVPGKTLREAWEAIRKPCHNAGYDYVELGWHGMGHGSPEFPTVIYRPGWGPSFFNGEGIGDFVFEEGMTFGNNIDINNPAWRMDVGCKLSDFMVVRPGGAELLVGVPLEFPEVG